MGLLYNTPIRLPLNLFNTVILIIDFTYVMILILVNFTFWFCWQTSEMAWRWYLIPEHVAYEF
jgi:hypothetical protein